MDIKLSELWFLVRLVVAGKLGRFIEMDEVEIEVIGVLDEI